MFHSPGRADAGWLAPKKLLRQPVFLGAVTLFFILIIVYQFSIDIRASRGASITGDEPFYLLTTQSLLQDGDLDLTQQYERQSYREFFDHPDGLWRQSLPTEDGRLLSPHNPGLSVLLLPGFVAAGLHGAQQELLVIAALTWAFTFVLVARSVGASLVSWLATLAVALSATGFIYSTEIYPEMPAALMLVLSLLIVQGKDRPGTLSAIALALTLTAMAWLGVKYVPLGMLVGGYFLLRAKQEGKGTLLVLALPSAVAYVWFHLATFGELTPYSINTVYAGDSTLEVANSHFTFGDRIYRLWGLFIDQRFGLIRWSPVLLLALPGVIAMVRSGPLPRLMLSLIITQVLIATFVAITMMGWWFPGRTLATVLPLFALPIALVLKQAPILLRAAAAILGAYSLAITAALAHAGRTSEITIAVDPFAMSNDIFQATARLFPNYTAWGNETVILTIVWLSLAAIVMTKLSLPYLMAAFARISGRKAHTGRYVLRPH